ARRRARGGGRRPPRPPVAGRRPPPGQDPRRHRRDHRRALTAPPRSRGYDVGASFDRTRDRGRSAGMKITVVGSGFVGQTTAMRLLDKGLGEVCLIDIIEGKPQGLALDLKQAAPVEGYEPLVTGTNDYADTAGSAIVAIAGGCRRQPGMSRMDLLGKNAAIMRDVIGNVVPGSPDAIVMVVSNPLDEMTYLAAEASGFPKHRVFGMAGVLDSARL